MTTARALWRKHRRITLTDGCLVEALSPREIEILRLAADGLGDREIGERVGIAFATVRTHMCNVLAKLNLSNRTQAANWARSVGLVEPVRPQTVADALRLARYYLELAETLAREDSPCGD